MRVTMSLPMLNRLATSRVIQWVDLPSGVAWSVSCATSSTVPSRSHMRSLIASGRPILCGPTTSSGGAIIRAR